MLEFKPQTQIEHKEEIDDDPKQLSPLDANVVELNGLSEEEFRKEDRRLVLKMDFRLMPVLFVLLVLNYLDRNALPAARVQGIEKSLGMKGNQFNVAISVLFVGYILGQIPSNLILSRVRPSLYLSGCVAVWGVVSGCTGAADTYAHLVVIRFFLGFTESPYFPGALFLLSSWYTKKELALRTSILYTGSLLASAFSGFITAGIQANMDGARGIEAWRWLFIIEGSITVFAALLAMVLLPDYPATTRWLSDREKALAVLRLERDSGVRDEETMSSKQAFIAAVTDYKVWLLSLIIVTKTTAAAVTSFIPTVVNTFGKSKVETLLLTAPPYLLAAILSLVMSYSSDRKPERCYHLLSPLLVAMVGCIVAASTRDTAPRYVSLFLMIGGLYASYNVALAWISSTIPRPRAKRAVAYATVNAIGNFAQIWSPYMYDKKYSPRYIPAFSVNAIMCALAVFFCLVLRHCLKRENAKSPEILHVL